MFPWYSQLNTLGPNILGHLLLQYRSCFLSEVKSVLVTLARTKNCPYYEGFFYDSEGLSREVPFYTCILYNQEAQSLLSLAC